MAKKHLARVLMLRPLMAHSHRDIIRILILAKLKQMYINMIKQRNINGIIKDY